MRATRLLFVMLLTVRDRLVPRAALQPVRGRTARALRNVAARYEATLAQVALAWLLHRPDVMVIPKAASAAHVDENRAALDLHLDADDLSELDAAFPPPVDATPLEMG